jgi:endonuclease YncB( thermonuclease family)
MRLPGARTLSLVLLSLAFLSFIVLRAHTRRARTRPVRATTFPPASSARLVHVVDGDTAYFALKDGRWVKGRLAGINTPECHKQQVRIADRQRSSRCHKDDELFGLRAYIVLKKLLASGELSLDCIRKRSGQCKRGSHGRVLIKIRANNKDVAEQLVRRGVAWTYTKYPSEDRARLCLAENEARARRVGMWAEGTVNEVLAMMSPRTRKWYADHDRLCESAQKHNR